MEFLKLDVFFWIAYHAISRPGNKMGSLGEALKERLQEARSEKLKNWAITQALESTHKPTHTHTSLHIQEL